MYFVPVSVISIDFIPVCKKTHVLYSTSSMYFIPVICVQWGGVKRIKSTIGALCMVRRTFGYKAKILIYNGLTKAYLSYGFLAWADCLNKTQLKELESFKKKL